MGGGTFGPLVMHVNQSIFGERNDGYLHHCYDYINTTVKADCSYPLPSPPSPNSNITIKSKNTQVHVSMTLHYSTASYMQGFISSYSLPNPQQEWVDGAYVKIHNLLISHLVQVFGVAKKILSVSIGRKNGQGIFC